LSALLTDAGYWMLDTGYVLLLKVKITEKEDTEVKEED
jgi:hypothetical protein